ncbi:hypothetical protein PC129_g8071 [Phytophthora cactorum]|uniref:Uncharacterized protein n=1 Tax=Phytophthora cactorum TaxID=29920 RepID=A0A329S7T3_9STRA|nr:hypothetical protein Pcac1_g24381 [Phytophthora cactorum]KAG2803738.1 hypothetical protein PC111_g18563 [Phytophthora cactorum]KAG2828374.1 hypothetical protein PC112_g8479 [Phytophthora cactorum]KAG2842698.1 hypothetical protein PC113_g18749 [Phytophthora cactorum]KAG2911454.1 hypothetical protein PC114_g9350 [Phytophthora cactorum]
MSETQLSDQYLYQSSLKSDPEIKVSSGKRVPFVIDLNQGSYQNGIITIDATSQLNGSEGFACLRDAYIMLPYKVSMKNTHATNVQNAANRFCVGLKCGNFNVIDSMSLELNGKTIVSMADYKLFWNNIRAQTGYSPQYVEKHGAESFLYPDAAQSTKYSSATATTGDGYSNNTAISTTFTAGTISATASVANDGFTKRLLSNPPNAGADSSTSWPSTGAASATTTIANQLGRGAFVAGAGSPGAIMGTWNYMLKIKLTDLHPIFKELDLMANPQIRLRFRVNQGTSAIDVDASRNMTLTGTTLSSGNVCPVMVASATSPNPMYNALSVAGSIAVAWGAVVNSLEPTIDGTYMPFTTSRLYVPFVHLENPQAIISKPVKKVRYNDCYAQWFYQRAGIGKQSTQLNAAFDLQLSASVKNAKYVILLPFAEQTGSFASAAVQEFQSPFDSAPWTLHPGSSIRNFNVRIGSQQTFDISHDYDFHHFTNEIAKIASINGDLTPELVNGLLDYQTWSLTNRVLIADVSRLTERDVPQAIQVQGVNAGCQGTNMLVLVVSEQELTLDRLTGEILEYSTA